MKNIMIWAAVILITLSSCSSYTMAGATMGGFLGSAVGRLAGGYAGSDIGTLVGAAAGASLGAAAEAKEQAEYERRARIRAEQYAADDVYRRDVRSRQQKGHFDRRTRATKKTASSTRTVRMNQGKKSYRFEIVENEPGQKRANRNIAPADSSGYSNQPLYDDEIKME